jgi:1-acyl-sn-glycerol-3-phosphate acyltransferase
LYIILKLISNLVIFLFISFKLAGKENIPGKGALLIVANHLSVGDPVIIGAKMGRQVIFMAKEELFFNWFTSYFVRSFGAFPVYRGRTNLDAIRQANSVLEKGKVLGMFPEGKRSQNGGMAPAMFGSAMIAYHNHCPILPIGISGSETIRGLGWLLLRPRVKLNIGEPFYLNVHGQQVTREDLEGFTSEIMKHIAELLPEKYRGEYSIFTGKK